MYHPNIDLEGNVCLNILREDWKPVLNINTVIYGLNLLFTVLQLNQLSWFPNYWNNTFRKGEDESSVCNHVCIVVIILLHFRTMQLESCFLKGVTTILLAMMLSPKQTYQPEQDLSSSLILLLVKLNLILKYSHGRWVKGCF